MRKSDRRGEYLDSEGKRQRSKNKKVSKKERAKITADQNAENKRDARTKPNAKATNSVLGKTNSVVRSRKKAIEDMKKSDDRRKKLLSKKTTLKENPVVKRKLKIVDGLAGIPGAPNSIPSLIRKKKTS